LTIVPVLGYHSISDETRDGTLRWSVSPGDFEEQMALLRERGCTPLTIGRYVELLRRRVPLPPRPVVVTFDDGFADLATAALPVLRRYDVGATAYVITSRLGIRPALDRAQLADLHRAGVEIGSHSDTHRPLDCLTPAALRRETVESRARLEDWLQAAVTSFAYPYGYHSRAVRQAVIAAGYSSACAVKNALSHPGDDVFAIARVLVERTTGVAGIDNLLEGRGWPVSWRGERLRTRGWRAYRRVRRVLDGAGRPG
jgi:peptidoglycan/xylan/chitin deacetylase (PgdA/CDA1 family)